MLRQYFEQLGDIQELTIKRGPEGKCLGFAFMTFRTAECVDRVQQSRPHSVQGRTLETRRQTPKQYVGTPEAKLQVKKIWIGAPEDEKGKRGHSGLGDNTSGNDTIINILLDKVSRLKRFRYQYRYCYLKKKKQIPSRSGC